MICGYNPYWTLFPPAIPFLCRRQGTPDIIHSTPDYATFFKRGKAPLIINFVLDREAVVHGHGTLRRFLPPQIVSGTIENDSFWEYLTDLIYTECNHVIHKLEKA